MNTWEFTVYLTWQKREVYLVISCDKSSMSPATLVGIAKAIYPNDGIELLKSFYNGEEVYEK